MNKIKFTLDNLIYDIAINNSEDLYIELPHKIPNITPVTTDKNTIESTTETTIKAFIQVNAKPVPKLYIVGQDDSVKIVKFGSFDLTTDTLFEISFSTTNGGASWLVNSCNLNATNAEAAAEAAAKAQETAETATETANTANQTANTATETANAASQTAEAATATANTAKSTAEDLSQQLTALTARVKALEDAKPTV